MSGYLNMQPSTSSEHGRLVLKNVPNSTNENELREHFKQYGPIKEVIITRTSPRRLVGTGFVVFYRKANAAEALKSTNKKPFEGIVVIVDWANPIRKSEGVIKKRNKATKKKNKSDHPPKPQKKPTFKKIRNLRKAENPSDIIIHCHHCPTENDNLITRLLKNVIMKCAEELAKILFKIMLEYFHKMYCTQRLFNRRI